jgi:hypothetical protein
MATKRPTPPDRAPQPAKKPSDEARFEAWLRDFDARQADLTARLDAILHSLGVDPARVPELA